MRQPFTLKDILNSPAGRLNGHLVEVKDKKANKYHAHRVEYDGKWFDSLKERARYIVLKYLEKEGEIKNLEHHVEFLLESNGKKVCNYIADFAYIQTKSGNLIVEDTKSPATRKLAPYRLKKKMMAAQYKIEIKEV